MDALTTIVDKDVVTWRHIDPDVNSWRFLHAFCPRCKRPGTVFGDGMRWKVYCKVCERKRRARRAEANRIYQRAYYWAHRQEPDGLRAYKLDALFKLGISGTFTVSQVAIMANCSTRHVSQRWIAEGKLDAWKEGCHWRIRL